MNGQRKEKSIAKAPSLARNELEERFTWTVVVHFITLNIQEPAVFAIIMLL